MRSNIERDYKLILCADDEQSVIASLRRIFHSSPYQLIWANNGEECLRIARMLKPDLIFLDIRMPFLDGHEVLQKLHNMGLSDTPVVFLTGESSDEAILRGYSEGGVYYITKPFNNYQIRNITAYLIGEISEHQRSLLEIEL